MGCKAFAAWSLSWWVRPVSGWKATRVSTLSPPHLDAQTPPFGHGPLAIFPIHDLAGSVFRVEPHGQVYDTALVLYEAFEEGDVALVRLPVLELHRQAPLRLLGLGKDEYAGGVHVEAVD